MIEDYKTDAQQILEELYTEKVLAFRLRAFQVDHIEDEEYTVLFHDSRFQNINVSRTANQCFKDVFRSAILKRMGRMKVVTH